MSSIVEGVVSCTATLYTVKAFVVTTKMTKNSIIFREELRQRL